MLGHHYQREEVIQFADVTGDSFKLAQQAAARPDAEYIVFCGVHFMAERADILTADAQQVVLPDLAAGCSMADMADLRPGRGRLGRARRTPGVADVDRAGHVHELVGGDQGLHRPARRHGLHVVERASARCDWAFGDRGEKVLFLPDQHLGRNTAVLRAGHVAGRLRASTRTSRAAG